MSKINDIVLRPRFKFEVKNGINALILAFNNKKSNQSEFIISVIDSHVFIKFPKNNQKFWTPQLHLEFEELNQKSTLIRGLFGPNPTVWTMFMFFHFIVAGLFIGFTVWAYTNWALNNSFALQISLMFLMVIVWLVLYFSGRIGKASNTEEMQSLYRFMNSTIHD